MPRIIFIAFDGTRTEVDAPEGTSVMQAAVDNSVAGIDGDCGGASACGTCHVKVDSAWIEKLQPIAEEENTMLDMVPERHERSRLGCQLNMCAELDGIVVNMPEAQH